MASTFQFFKAKLDASSVTSIEQKRPFFFYVSSALLFMWCAALIVSAYNEDFGDINIAEFSGSIAANLVLIGLWFQANDFFLNIVTITQANGHKTKSSTLDRTAAQILSRYVQDAKDGKRFNGTLDFNGVETRTIQGDDLVGLYSTVSRVKYARDVWAFFTVATPIMLVSALFVEGPDLPPNETIIFFLIFSLIVYPAIWFTLHKLYKKRPARITGLWFKNGALQKEIEESCLHIDGREEIDRIIEQRLAPMTQVTP